MTARDYYGETFTKEQLQLVEHYLTLKKAMYGAPFLFEQFCKGIAIDWTLVELEYEELEKLQAQLQRMRNHNVNG